MKQLNSWQISGMRASVWLGLAAVAALVLELSGLARSHHDSIVVIGVFFVVGALAAEYDHRRMDKAERNQHSTEAADRHGEIAGQLGELPFSHAENMGAHDKTHDMIRKLGSSPPKESRGGQPSIRVLLRKQDAPNDTNDGQFYSLSVINDGDLAEFQAHVTVHNCQLAESVRKEVRIWGLEEEPFRMWWERDEAPKVTIGNSSSGSILLGATRYAKFGVNDGAIQPVVFTASTDRKTRRPWQTRTNFYDQELPEYIADLRVAISCVPKMAVNPHVVNIKMSKSGFAILPSDEERKKIEQMVDVFKKLTDDESKFLAFFGDGPESKLPARDEPPIRHAVYNAFRRLASKNVLTHSEDERHFALTDVAVQAWDRGAFARSRTRSAIDIDLGTVLPSGQTGSGAHVAAARRSIGRSTNAGTVRPPPQQQMPNVELETALYQDRGIVLSVKNLGAADDFQAQIVGWSKGATQPQPTPAATLKWINGDGRLHKILTGATEHLEIAQAAYHKDNDNDVVDASGKPRQGMAEVKIGWDFMESLGIYSYWEAENFETQLWSLHVVISAAGSQAARHQGVRLHLFGKHEDDPTDNRYIAAGWPVLQPWLRASLFPLVHAV